MRRSSENGRSSLRLRISQAFTPTATTWLNTVDSATPVMPCTGRLAGPKSATALPTTVNTSPSTFTTIGSSVWPQARSSVDCAMLSAMKHDRPP